MWVWFLFWIVSSFIFFKSDTQIKNIKILNTFFFYFSKFKLFFLPVFYSLFKILLFFVWTNFYSRQNCFKIIITSVLYFQFFVNKNFTNRKCFYSVLLCFFKLLVEWVIVVYGFTATKSRCAYAHVRFTRNPLRN